jgi:Fe-S cluster biogenesis protein NfuA
MDKSREINLIKMALEGIRPFLQEDDGNIEFVELTDDNILKIRYSETCKNCKFKEQTRFIVEKYVRRFFPQLKEMIEVD